jgi:hypothetical protein
MQALFRFIVMALLVSGFAGVAAAEVSTRPANGCFRVLVDSLNVRRTAFATGDIIAVAREGDILIKRKRWCTWRGFWCAVTTEDGIEGYVDKKFIEVAACPARLSR